MTKNYLLKAMRRFSKPGLFLILLLVSIVLCSSEAGAQAVKIVGTVTDANNQPLDGVNITWRNTGTTSNQDGSFTISAPVGEVLTFSHTGYVTKEVRIENENALTVTLDEMDQSLESVVVIGYGTASKKDVTGSISSIQASRLENENPQSVTDVLKGNIPGLNVGMNTSAKGGNADNLLVRGRTTLSAGTSPLIVVDGVIYYGQLADINPNDIESVDVLKDASSLAVYGAKAATGVVAITTKKGRSASPVITLNTNVGLARLAKNQRVYGPEGFLNWRADVMRSGASTPSYLYDNPNNLPDGITMDQWLDGKTGDPVDIWLDRLGLVGNEKANYYAGKTIDWYDAIFRTGMRQDHTVSISGKKEDINYYMSLGYQKNQNLIEGGEYSNARFRVNLEAKAAKFLTLGMNLQYAIRDEGSIEADWGQLTNLSPYGDMYNEDGTLRRIPTDDNGLNARNPFLNMTYNDNFNMQNTLFGSLYSKINLPFGITYQINYTPNIDVYRTFTHNSSENPNVTIPGGTASRANEVRYNWQIDNLLKWNKTFGGIHTIDVTLLANAEKYQTWWTQANNQGFVPTDELGYHNIGSGIQPTVSSEDKVYTGDALMARINYSLMGRYNLTASVRRDGYSVFGVNFKRATFPAVALAWTFTEENFMKSLQWLNFGKLRLSYGINGNRDLRNPDNNTVDPYAALTQLIIGKYQVVDNNGSPSSVNTVRISDRMANSNLKWEQTRSINMGLDFAVLSNRLSGSIDLYQKRTNDLLVRQTLPNVTGYANVYSNLAAVDNKGIELSLSSKNIEKENLTWNTNLIFALNRNKIVRLATPSDDPGNGWFIGKDINVIWDYKVLGVWQENEAEEAAKFDKGIKPGDFKLQDVDGNYAYNDQDKQFIGYTTPRFTWALRNEFNFLKHFDFSFQLISSIGQKKQFNQAKNQPGSVGFGRSTSYILPYWTPDNPINDYARLNSGLSGTTVNVYRDNSFIRLNNISLGYNFSNKLLDRLRVRNAKVYATANNPTYWAPNWNYWDPENNGPTPAYYTLGLNISL